MLDGVALLYGVWNLKATLFKCCIPETNTSQIKIL